MPHSSGQDRPLGPGVLQRCLRAAVWAPWGMRGHHAEGPRQCPQAHCPDHWQEGWGFRR